MNKRKIKNGLKKTLIAISLAFTGPILFVLGVGREETTKTEFLLIIIGGGLMIGCVIIGIISIKEIIAGFFEKSNE